jgi:hypothetical protein
MVTALSRCSLGLLPRAMLLLDLLLLDLLLLDLLLLDLGKQR